MTGWWWLSFAGEGERGNLGACIVNGKTFDAAVAKSHRLKINPGGEVMGVEYPTIEAAKGDIRKWGARRLISRDEMARSGDCVRFYNDEPVEWPNEEPSCRA